MKQHLKQGIIFSNTMLYLLALTAAVGLKYHYSNATSDDLIWILYPTAVLVEHITGFHFIREAHAGFINYSSGILIAPSCSGVNFLIITFCTVFFSFAHHVRSLRLRWLWLGISLSSAYLLTIVVNSLRIIVAIFLIDNNVHYGWLTSDRIHRIEGAVIYFSILSIFYIIMRRIIIPRDPPDREEKSRTISGKVPIAAIPLFWYLLVALASPIVTGNYRQCGLLFIEHVWMVGLSCLSVFLAIQLIQLFSKRILFKTKKNMTSRLYI